jgi:hypothetical protein
VIKINEHGVQAARVRGVDSRSGPKAQDPNKTAKEKKGKNGEIVSNRD